MQAIRRPGFPSSRLVPVVLLAVLMALPGSAVLAEHAVSAPAAPVPLTAAQLIHAPLTHASQSPASILGASTDLGPIAPATSFYFTVSFSLRNQAGLASLIQGQENPGSPLYRQFLTASQFDQEFGPSPLLVTEATSYFSSFGLTYVNTGSPLALGFRGPASAVEAAFHSPIDQYRMTDGTIQYTDSEPLALPAPLASFVSSVSGVSSFPVMQPTYMAPPGANSHGFGSSDASAPPTSGTLQEVVNWTKPAYLYAPNGFPGVTGTTPYQFLNPATMTVAYNATALYANGDEGQGSTIAVVMGVGYNPSDLATFSNETFGNPTQLLSRLSAYPVAGPSGNASAPGTSYLTGGLSFEFSIDLEYSSTMAPKAHIDAVYGQGLDAASLVSDYAKVASLIPVPNVVTNSWGGPEDDWWNLMGPSWQGGGAMENQMEELAALGCTVLFSSADYAGYDSYTGFLSPSFPASSPYVTSVGGTRTTVGNYLGNSFPAANFTVNTTAAIYANSELGSGPFWFPNITLNAVYVHGVTNESYWYTPYAGEPLTAIPYAGGGIGLSYWFQQPWWQHGFTVSDTGRRMTADIAAEADFNETVYFDSGWNYFWGGTSFACPTVAGEIALIDTYLNMTIGPTTGRHSYYNGLIDPLLYDIANDVNITTPSFDQITAGSNPFSVLAAQDGYTWPGDQNWPAAATGVTTGWNLLTGWGVPNVGQVAMAASALLTQGYYVAFANGTAALTAPSGTYTFTVQTTGTVHTPAISAPYELWFSAAGLTMGTPVESSGTTTTLGAFTYTASTPGFLEIYVQYAGKQIFQSIWFSPAPLTGGTLSIALVDGTPSSMMGGFDAYSAFYSGSYPYEYPAAGPVIPNSVVVEVTYKATPSSAAVPVYNALVIGQTNYTGYWDSPPYIENPAFNYSLLPFSTNTSLTLTNLDGVSYVPTWNVPVPETYWINATYLGLTASLTYQVTPHANVEGVGPIETYIPNYVDVGYPGYLGYSANNTVVAPAVVGEGNYTLPVSFTNWEGQPLVGATVDIALPPVVGPPFLSTPIPGTQTKTNATGIAEFTIGPSISALALEIGFLAIQVYNSSYADATVPSLLADGTTPIWLDDSEGLLVMYTPAAYMSTIIYADGGTVPSEYVGTTGAVAGFEVETPGGVFSHWNNITSLTYSLDGAAATSVPLGSAGQSLYAWSVALPTLAIGTHTFTVTMKDSEGFTYVNVNTFYVIGTGALPTPGVTITAPSANSYVSGDVTVSWNVDESAAYLTDETLTVTQGTFVAVYNVTGMTSYAVSSAELSSGQVTFTVAATNVLGQQGTADVSAYEVTEGVSALITSPANGASFFAGTTVTVGFSWSGDFLSKESLLLTAPGGTPQTIALTSTSYSITNVVVGEYKLTLNVSSASGAYSLDSITFNVTAVKTTTTTTGYSALDLALLAVVGLVIGVLVGVLIGRSGRRPQAAPPMTPYGSTAPPSGAAGAPTPEWKEESPTSPGPPPPYQET